MGLFDRFGLETNVEKMAIMICQLCKTIGSQLLEAHIRWVIGERHTYRERQWERVLCPDYGVELAAGSPTAQRENQNGRGRELHWAEALLPLAEYMISFMRMAGTVVCLVEGCRGKRGLVGQ